MEIRTAEMAYSHAQAPSCHRGRFEGIIQEGIAPPETTAFQLFYGMDMKWRGLRAAKDLRRCRRYSEVGTSVPTKDSRLVRGLSPQLQGLRHSTKADWIGRAEARRSSEGPLQGLSVLAFLSLSF